MYEEEIKKCLCGILSSGISRIRLRAEYGEKIEEISIDAVHLHNLPKILINYTEEKFNYYWLVEKPSYVRDLGEFDSFYAVYWERIESILKKGEGGQ